MDDEKWGEDLASFILVVSAAMVLRPIVAVVGRAGAPKISELFLVVTVAQPSKSHVHGFGSARHDIVGYNTECGAVVGTYCEVHDEPAPTNTMVTRSTPAIVLGPTGNLQGTYKFLSLATGKKVKRLAFTLYPMPDSVIKKVEAYGKSTALPGIFDFANRNSILFEWNEEVDEFLEGIVDIEDVVLYPSLAAEHPGVVLGRDQPLPSIEEELVPLKGEPKTLRLAMPTSSRSTSQEWWQRRSYTPTRTNLMNKIDDDDGIISVGAYPNNPLMLP